MDRRLFFLSFLALAGCASLPPPPPPAPLKPAETALGELEPLYAATAGRDAIVISVPSNGCTTRADFTFYLERKAGAVTLAFARKRLDTCKSFAMGKTELTFTWSELGLEPRTPVFLLNPLTPWTGPGS